MGLDALFVAVFDVLDILEFWLLAEGCQLLEGISLGLLFHTDK